VSNLLWRILLLAQRGLTRREVPPIRFDTTVLLEQNIPRRDINTLQFDTYKPVEDGVGKQVAVVPTSTFYSYHDNEVINNDGSKGKGLVSSSTSSLLLYPRRIMVV
jgi:hypothetical protein